jgi:protein SCO1
MNRRTCLAALLASVPLAVSCKFTRGAPLPNLGQVPSVELVDQTGLKTTFGKLGPRPLFVAFFFTRCPSICPRLVARMKEIEAALGSPSKAGFVLVSVDPEHDSAEVLENYSVQQKLSSTSFSLLTGDYKQIANVAESGFRIGLSGSYAPDKPDLGITHGSHLVLVDKRGQIRKYVRTFDDDAVKQAIESVEALEGE